MTWRVVIIAMGLAWLGLVGQEAWAGPIDLPQLSYDVGLIDAVAIGCGPDNDRLARLLGTLWRHQGVSAAGVESLVAYYAAGLQEGTSWPPMPAGCPEVRAVYARTVRDLQALIVQAQRPTRPPAPPWPLGGY